MGDALGASVQRACGDQHRYIVLHCPFHQIAVVTDLIKCVRRMQSDKTRRRDPNEILIAHTDVYTFFLSNTLQVHYKQSAICSSTF